MVFWTKHCADALVATIFGLAICAKCVHSIKNCAKTVANLIPSVASAETADTPSQGRRVRCVRVLSPTACTVPRSTFNATVLQRRTLWLALLPGVDRLVATAPWYRATARTVVSWIRRSACAKTVNLTEARPAQYVQLPTRCARMAQSQTLVPRADVFIHRRVLSTNLVAPLADGEAHTVLTAWWQTVSASI